MKQFFVTLDVVLEAEDEDNAFEKVSKLVHDIRDFSVDIYEGEFEDAD